MHEERKQMLQKIIDNEEQWKKAKREVTQVVAQHGLIQTILEEQKQRSFMEVQKVRVSDNIHVVLCVLHKENKGFVFLLLLFMLNRKR